MGDNPRQIARRVRLTRLALGFETQARFTAYLGINNGLYNTFEKPTSGRRISLAAAFKIRERFGVSLDWIYCGDPSLLPVELYRKIQELREERPGATDQRQARDRA